MSERIGLLGGTFNPPHLGHLLLGEWARDAMRLDAVWFVPNADLPHRYPKETPVPAPQRLAMLQAALDGVDGLAPCDLELRRGGQSYTVETLRALGERFPETEWVFILGMDAARELPGWEAFDELCTRCTFAVARRPGEADDLPAAVRPHAQVIDFPQVDISSTLIRARVRAGQSIRFLVPPATADYIARQGLYR